MRAGEIIRQARTLARLTQRELSEIVGMEQANISRLESGRRDPSMCMLRRLLAACDCELQWRVSRRAP